MFSYLFLLIAVRIKIRTFLNHENLLQSTVACSLARSAILFLITLFSPFSMEKLPSGFV